MTSSHKQRYICNNDEGRTTEKNRTIQEHVDTVLSLMPYPLNTLIFFFFNWYFYLYFLVFTWQNCVVFKQHKSIRNTNYKQSCKTEPQEVLGRKERSSPLQQHFQSFFYCTSPKSRKATFFNFLFSLIATVTIKITDKTLHRNLPVKMLSKAQIILTIRFLKLKKNMFW